MMIRSIYKIIILAIIMANFCAQLSASTNYKKETFTEVIQKTFDIDKDGKVELLNKYGKMDINTWDRAEVDVKVTIIVKAKSKDAAQEEFDRINVEFNNSRSSVSAMTEIESKQSSWWGWGSSSSSDFKIHYEVTLPNTVKLDASNKYGNMFVEQMNADLKVTQKYGDFEIDGVNGDLEFSLGYGNGSIAFVDNVEGYIKYSNLSIDKAENIELESKYSKMRFDKVKSLTTLSKYDKYTIGHLEYFKNEGKYDNIDIDEVDDVDIYTKYTDCRINFLNDTGEFECSYGGVRIEKLNEDFKNLEIEGSYTTIKVIREGSCSLDFDVETNYADIDIPSDSHLTQKLKEGSSRHYIGYTGSKGSGKKINADLNYGSFELR